MRYIILILSALVLNGCTYHYESPEEMTPHDVHRNVPAGYLDIPHELVQSLYVMHLASVNEQIMCLVGEQEGYHITITGLIKAKVLDTSPLEVTYEGCNEGDGTIGVWHSHPGVAPHRCYASAKDIVNLYRHSHLKVMLVSCEEESFSYSLKGYPFYHKLAFEGSNK